MEHPDPVVETSSLSSIQPPDIDWNQVELPSELIDNNRMSKVQLEAACYASQKHRTFLADGTRAGYLIG